MSGNKKGVKDVGVVTALKAFEATYRAACRDHGTLPCKPLLRTLQQAQENSVACDKILLSGASVDAAVATAVIECLASCPAVSSLCCYGCSIGDEGITAIANILRASAGKWWRGCRLQSLELCADGRALPLQPTPAAAALTAAQDNSVAAEMSVIQAAAPGSLNGTARIYTQSSAPDATGASRRTSTTGIAAAPAVSAVAAETPAPQPGPMVPNTHGGSPQARVSAGRPGTVAAEGTSRSDSAAAGALAGVLQQQHQLQRPSTAPDRTGYCCNSKHQLQLPPGVCPPVPAHLQLAFPTHLHLAQQSLRERCWSPEHIRYRAQPPRPLVQVSRWVLDATLEGWNQQRQQQQQPVDAAGLRWPMPEAAGKQQSQGVAEKMPAPQQQNVLPPQQQHDLMQQRNLKQGQQQVTSAAVLQADSCPRFSVHALQELSLGLGVAGLSLSQLVLDHTLLGDAGISTLSAGLSKCCSLKQLSLCYCGIGPAGVKDLAAACTNGGTATVLSGSSTAAAGSRLSAVTGNNPGGIISEGSAGLNLEELLLNGNPLNAAGLQQLNAALRVMSALKVLGLADICVSEVDKVQLQGLVYALTIGPTALEQLDFDANYIGDRAASHFLTLLPVKPSLLLLKLTARVSPDIMTQLTTLLEQNLKAAKPAKGKKKGKK